MRGEAVRELKQGFLFPPPQSRVGFAAPSLDCSDRKKTPSKQATSGLSPFSNKGYDMAAAVYGPFLSRFICSYYGKTYLPIGCFGDVIDN